MDEEIRIIFSYEMERGGIKADGEVSEKRTALYRAFDEYLEAVERHYFRCGYISCSKNN